MRRARHIGNRTRTPNESSRIVPIRFHRREREGLRSNGRRHQFDSVDEEPGEEEKTKTAFQYPQLGGFRSDGRLRLSKLSRIHRIRKNRHVVKRRNLSRRQKGRRRNRHTTHSSISRRSSSEPFLRRQFAADDVDAKSHLHNSRRFVSSKIDHYRVDERLVRRRASRRERARRRRRRTERSTKLHAARRREFGENVSRRNSRTGSVARSRRVASALFARRRRSFDMQFQDDLLLFAHAGRFLSTTRHRFLKIN